MKIPSLFYINKSLHLYKGDSGFRKYSLYGHGDTWPDVIISDGSKSFIEQVIPGQSLSEIGANVNGSVLELGNVTIERNISVCGLPTSLRNTPFFLKVSGTLTVKGHLHMDGMGAGTVSYDQSLPTYMNNGIVVSYQANALKYSNLVSTLLKDNSCCSDDAWAALNTYGSSDTFFTLTQGITGAGGCGLRYLNTSLYGVESRSPISGGGNISLLTSPSVGSSITGGGGGGFLSIYCNYFSNNGGYFYEGDYRYPLNIHANGGTTVLNSSQSIYGGGMMVIAARRLIIEPGGSITCDASQDGNGLMSIANRAPNQRKMLFNNSSPIEYSGQFSGGAGFCTLYKR